MNHSDMAIKKIICAVRGIPESQATVTHAIELAIHHPAHLTFFLVIDAEFLRRATPTMSPLSIIYQQLHEMSQFTMLILVDRAKRRGVKNVDYEIRKGNIPREIQKFALETDADLMCIGRPVRSPRRSVFKRAKFVEFTAESEQTTGLIIIPVPP